jgi:putative membrane protein
VTVTTDMADDPAAGLAAERTRLAWRRTGLALAAGSVAAARLLQEVVGGAAWALGAVGLTASAALLVAAYRRHTSGLAGGGRLVTVCAAAVVTIGAASVAMVLGGL